jgi:hypothetical protein
MRGTFWADPLVRMLAHTTVALALLTSTYYLVPLRMDWQDSWQQGRLGLCVAGLLAVGVLFVRSARRSSKQPPRYLRIQWLLSSLYMLVLLFAFVYALLGIEGSGQFAGISDRTDALYFSVTLVATVGFGDIHPTGTVAQLVVTAHMLFNLIYLGTALRLLTFPRADAPPLQADR